MVIVTDSHFSAFWYDTLLVIEPTPGTGVAMARWNTERIWLMWGVKPSSEDFWAWWGDNLLAWKIVQEGLNFLSFTLTSASMKATNSRFFQLHCCGINSYKDWDGVYPESNSSITLPESCCADYGDEDESDDCTRVYTLGCLPQLETFIRESIILLAGTASTIALIQVGICQNYQSGFSVDFLFKMFT